MRAKLRAGRPQPKSRLGSTATAKSTNSTEADDFREPTTRPE
jgi:hypothetical protein